MTITEKLERIGDDLRAVAEDVDVLEEHECEECDAPHCGDPGNECLAPEDVAQAREVLRLWHDATHPGALRFCKAEPCVSLAYVLGLDT